MVLAEIDKTTFDDHLLSPVLRGEAAPESVEYSKSTTTTLPRLPVAPSEIGLACIGGRPARHLAIGLASSLSVDTAVCAPRVRLYSATYP